jgi:hypothetical protein
VFHDAKTVYVLKEVLYEYTYNQESVTSTQASVQGFLSVLKSYLLMHYL